MISTLINKIDCFGQPVTLNYKGHSKFKTGFGLILTILSALIVIAFVVFASMYLVPEEI